MRNELAPCLHCGRVPAANTELDAGQQGNAQVAALAASQVHPESALPSWPDYAIRASSSTAQTIPLELSDEHAEHERVNAEA